MIYVTGDTHTPIDIKKLATKNFPEQKLLSKEDYLIILGDYGGVWDNSEEDRYWRRWLNNKNFTTLFVDGNHENFDLLNKYDVEYWNGGKVHMIEDSIIHLMRGQVFDIDGNIFFTMGGAESIDKLDRTEGKSWWKEELPSQKEIEEALYNLELNNWKVDYVLTHTTSNKNMEQMGYIKEKNILNSFFDEVQEKLQYKHWYCGHFHSDTKIDDKHTVVYRKVIKVV